MNKRQKYFLKQKLIGIAICGVGILAAMLGPDFLIATIIFAAIGIHFITTKEMVWVDDYWYEEEERKKEIQRKLEEKDIRKRYLKQYERRANQLNVHADESRFVK